MANRFAREKPPFATRSDTYTGTATGTSVSLGFPTLKFSIQVKGTGASATAWTVLLEGSLDGTNYSTLLTHQTSTLDGVVLSSSSDTPVMHFRSRCSLLTLGGASNVIATIVGVA